MGKEATIIQEEQVPKVLVDEVEIVLKKNDVVVAELLKYVGKKTWKMLANMNPNMKHSTALELSQHNINI